MEKWPLCKGKIQMIKILILTIACASLVLGLTTPAGASLYDINFNDGNGNSGSGQIDVESANNNFYAASGYLNLTTGGTSGEWLLYVSNASPGGTTSYPGYIYSPSGVFIYNNAVYPAGQNPQYPDTNPLLDNYGLLFTQNNGDEINIWGNADGTYNLGGSVGGQLNFNVNIGLGGGTSNDSMIAPVPEPSTFFAAAFLLVPIGASVVRLTLRKNRLNAGS